MDRDTFWEIFRDVFWIAFKIVLALVLTQLVLILYGSSMKIPLIYKWMMDLKAVWRFILDSVYIGY